MLDALEGCPFAIREMGPRIRPNIQPDAGHEMPGCNFQRRSRQGAPRSTEWNLLASAGYVHWTDAVQWGSARVDDGKYPSLSLSIACAN